MKRSTIPQVMGGTKVVNAEVIQRHLKTLRRDDAKVVISWRYAHCCNGLRRTTRRRNRATGMRSRTSSARVTGKAVDARSSKVDVCDEFLREFSRDVQFFFETSGRATSVNSRAMKASENVKDECDMISRQTSYTVVRS